MLASPLRKAAAATAALLFTAAPGLGGCPTGEDIGEGIVLAQNAPFFMRGDFKATPEGFVEMRIIDMGGQVQESMALYRHGLVMTGEHSPAGHVEINYVDDLRPVETLPDAGSVSISGVAKGPKGEAYVELELEFVDHGTIALAECEYETWTVKSSLMDRNGAGAAFQVEYAPELDLVLSAGQIGPDGALTAAYRYQWAGTAADVAR